MNSSRTLTYPQTHTHTHTHAYTLIHTHIHTHTHKCTSHTHSPHFIYVICGQVMISYMKYKGGDLLQIPSGCQGENSSVGTQEGWEDSTPQRYLESHVH